MFTDMVGSTASAQANETMALQLRDEHEELVRPLFATHHGREIKSMGDGFLTEFDSALRAVQCAIDIHQHLEERNAQPGVTPIRLRIGIHLGDVEERGGDIFGDAVNIASRIEPLASPGGLCVSGPVFDQVRNKIPNPFEKIEPKPLKGVQGPLDLYRVVMPWTAREPILAGSRSPRLAVLPLANISPDPKDEYFADGLTEELISVLSQIRGLGVIARTSVNQYKSTAKPVAQIGSELGVSSVLEGSVRKAGNRIRITLQLIDVASQQHTWSESYNRELDDVFAIQAEVAERTAKALRIEFLESDREALCRPPTSNIAAYGLYLRGIHASRRRQALDQLQSQTAAKFFEAAIDEDPRFAQAYAALADLLIGMSGEVRPGREVLPRARELTAKALELDPSSSDAHTAQGNLAMQADLDWARAEAEFGKAIAQNPNNSNAHFWHAVLLFTLQEFDAAKAELHTTLELDPLWPLAKFWLFLVQGASGEEQELQTSLREYIAEKPNELWPHLMLGWSYLKSGKRAEALQEAERSRGTLGPEMAIRRAALFAMLGQPHEAEQIAGEWGGPGTSTFAPPLHIAILYSALGQREKALELLEYDLREGERSLWFDYQYPSFDPIRDDPRFQSMLRSMNLPASLGRRRIPV
jgi:adenylate cyclase